jgi:hypothetical protein
VCPESRYFFTGTGPILILTSYESLDDPELGEHFNLILGDLKQADDVRVLDYDGYHECFNDRIL